MSYTDQTFSNTPADIVDIFTFIKDFSVKFLGLSARLVVPIMVEYGGV